MRRRRRSWMEWRAQSRRVTLTAYMDDVRHAHNLSHALWCAMSEDDDNTNEQEDYVHTHLSSVAFHVHCVGLGCHVVIGVGRLIVRFHHAYVIPSFLLHVVVRLYLVIVNSNCSHSYCLLHIAKTGHLRCYLYKNKSLM